MDRGCSAPGCDMPGYLCEVHHVQGWAECYRKACLPLSGLRTK
jgi:hypothetical protein